MIKLIGLGQSFRGDDGIGIISVKRWMDQHPTTANNPSLHVEILESPGLALLDSLDGAKFALLVDAVQTGKPPGTIHHVSSEDLDSFLPDSKSAHGWGVAETLFIEKQVNTIVMPEKILIIAIEAENFKVGTTISPLLDAKLPEIVKIIQDNISELLLSL